MGLSAGQLSLCVISASSVPLIMKQFGARDAQPGGQRDYAVGKVVEINSESCTRGLAGHVVVSI